MTSRPTSRTSRCSTPIFPIRRPADQFFNESQFESYRGLGGHIGQEVFSRAVSILSSPPSPPGGFPTAEPALVQEAQQMGTFASNPPHGDGPSGCILRESSDVLKQAQSLEDCMTPTFLECRSVVRASHGIAGPEQVLSRLGPDQGERLAESGGVVLDLGEPSDLLGDSAALVPTPAGPQPNSRAATQAFSRLQATLRSDRNLRQLSRELYPELDITETSPGR